MTPGLVSGLVFSSRISSSVAVSEKSAALHAIIQCSAVGNVWGVLDACGIAADNGAVKGDRYHCDPQPLVSCGRQKKR